MAVKLIACDRCQAPIEKNRAMIHVESGTLRKSYQAVDLCEPCRGSFVRWMVELDNPATMEPKPLSTTHSA